MCVRDGFSGPVGSECRKLMEFSTSKQRLPSNQFNTARLKPTHIHQFWLDRHCDPDACSDGPAGVSCFSACWRGQRSPISLPGFFTSTLLAWDFLCPDKTFDIFELSPICLFRWGRISYPWISNQVSLITASYRPSSEDRSVDLTLTFTFSSCSSDSWFPFPQRDL